MKTNRNDHKETKEARAERLGFAKMLMTKVQGKVKYSRKIKHKNDQRNNKETDR